MNIGTFDISGTTIFTVSVWEGYVERSHEKLTLSLRGVMPLYVTFKFTKSRIVSTVAVTHMGIMHY
jgi:hypothetical protein